MTRTTRFTRSGMIFLALLPVIAGIVIISRIEINQRTYKSQFKVERSDNDNGAEGMIHYFFNARKNNITGKMDYAAMVNAENQIETYMQTHRASAGALGLSWTNLGPTNVGGRTRAILFDNTDPTGNTMFAAAASGGIWKSTNAGASWSPVADNLQSLAACDLAQDVNGVIYCGTGEGFSLYSEGDGFSTAIIGGGIFKSSDDGKTFTRLASTEPAPSNDTIANVAGANWAFTNRIAISPCNPNVIYAATNTGLFISKNAGVSWSIAYNSATNKKIFGNCLDVKISTDGGTVIAGIAGSAYISNPTCGAFDTLFKQVVHTGKGSLPSCGSTIGRMEFAISPSNSNYIYASVVNDNTNGFVGIYMTKNGGSYWYDIGPGGGSFNPYGGNNQGWYDNTMAVFPDNPGQILVGGTTLWTWQNKPADTLGSWQNLTYYSAYPGFPYYIHPDEHAIVFNPYNHNNVWVGCDGGMYESININNVNANPPGFPTWAPMNRDYNVTQFYFLANSPYVDPVNNEGIIGGTQDNGTPYVNGLLQYPQDEVGDMSGGDGSGVAISYINPNVFFTTIESGNALNRGNNLGVAAFPSNFYTSTIGTGHGADIGSMSGSGCWAFPVALYENMYDNNTIDSLRWIADKSYKAGDTIYPISPNGGGIPFSVILPKSMVKNDSLMIKDPIVSKVAVGFSGSNYVWMTMQATDLSGSIIWMPIGGANSKPDAFTGGPVHCLAWSPDGDALFVGTESGQLYRFSNLDSIRDTSYITGAVYSLDANKNYVGNPLCRVHSKSMTGVVGGRDVLSIAVNPNNGNQIVVTLGNYGNSTYVYYCGNALSANPTFTPVQGTGLPQMPVYSSSFVFSNGGPANAVIIGTEHGVYSTTNITAPTVVWTPENNGGPNTLVMALHQQTTPPWLCNNSGSIYMGTHGRGAWVSTSLGALGVPQIVQKESVTGLLVYPNPMSTAGTIEYNLKSAENISIKVYDLQGRMVENINPGRQSEGDHHVAIATSNYKAGTYIVSVSGASLSKAARFVVVK